MTPNATAMMEAITMSIVRQRWVFMDASQQAYREETHARRTSVSGHGGAGEDRASCAGITQIRFEGLRCHPHSQRCALPCRMACVSMTLTPPDVEAQRGSHHMQTEHREITARGLTFDVYEGGPADGEP